MTEENGIDERDAEFMCNLDNERRARTFYQEDLPQDIIQEISNSAAQDVIHQFANGQMSTRELVTRLLSIIRNNDTQFRIIRSQSGIPGLGMTGGIGASAATMAAIAMSDDNIEKLILLKNIVTSMKCPPAPTGSVASDKRANELDLYMDEILKEIYTAISEIAKAKVEK